MADDVLYDDGLVRLDRQEITLRRYYFPIATAKRIRYSDIQAVHRRTMGPLTGKGRLWGSGDFRHWAPLDVHRPKKDVAVVLDLGRAVQPVFSPDDPDRVLELIHEHAPRAGGWRSPE